MQALVTGGAGFLGSCLVDRLLAAGLAVDVLDDLTQGQMNNLRQALTKDQFQFHLGSVLQEDRVAPLVARADLVFHLAAVVGMPIVMGARKRTLEVNARGSYNLLHACAEQGKRCLLFSSSEVYGSGNGALFSEEDRLDPGPRGSARWYYAVSKICAEKAGLALYRDQGLPVTVVRPFNATGPRQSLQSGMVMPSFVRSAILGEDLAVFGTGRQRRTFISCEDMTDQVIHIAMDEKTLGKVINVGGQEEYSIEDLARKVIDTLGSVSQVKQVGYAEAYGDGYTEIERRRPDLGRLERLGYLSRLRPISEVISEMGAAMARDKEKLGAD